MSTINNLQNDNWGRKSNTKKRSNRRENYNFFLFRFLMRITETTQIIPISRNVLYPGTNCSRGASTNLTKRVFSVSILFTKSIA